MYSEPRDTIKFNQIVTKRVAGNRFLTTQSILVSEYSLFGLTVVAATATATTAAATVATVSTSALATVSA